LAALEARIARLEEQTEDVGEAVAAALNDLRELARAVHEAKKALAAASGERALRRRAEAGRAVVGRVGCTFTATGEGGGGWGKRSAGLVKGAVHPVVGDPVEFPADPKSALARNSGVSRR